MTMAISTFAPICQVCGDSYHGHGAFVFNGVQVAADGTGDMHNHFPRLVWPSCQVCGRVLTENDHAADAGTDGKVFWHNYEHSPAGLAAEATTAAAVFAKEQQMHADSRSVFQQIVDNAVATRVQPIIDKAVADALAAHGIVVPPGMKPAPAPKVT